MSKFFDCGRTAPVSHQKQAARSEMNAAGLLQKRRKINGGGDWPAAHNGLGAASSAV
jgi:hypothetical protein